MSNRQQFLLPNVTPGTRVRFDTASGSYSAADVVDNLNQAISGSILTGDKTGRLASGDLYGPVGVTTLYMKTLDGSGNVTGSPTTLASAHPASASSDPRVDAILAGAPADRDTFGELPAVFAPILTPTGTKTAAYTAAPGDLVPVSTAGGAVTVTLPAAPANGARVAVKHTVQGGTNAVTIAAGGTDHFNTASGPTSATLTMLNQAVQLQYAAGVWLVVADDLPLSQLDSRFLKQTDAAGAYALDGTGHPGTNDLTAFGIYLPERYGASALAVGLTGNMTNGSAVLTDAAAAFTAGDVGKTIIVGATGYSSALVTTIASRQSATQVTLAATAPAAQTNVAYYYGADSTAGLTAMLAAMPAGSQGWLAGLYLTTTGGATLAKTAKLRGNGAYGINGTMAGSGIVCTSPTATALVENAYGIVMEDLGVFCLSPTTPTAGAGISVTLGSHGAKRNVTVSGFYNDIDYTSTSGRYWSMTNCTVADPVNDGVYIHNTAPSGDEGDMFIGGGTQFVLWAPSRVARSAVRWESGGGLKMSGFKINGHTPSYWQHGVDICVADGVGTVDILLTNYSIEAFSVAGIRVTQKGPSNTGGIGNLNLGGAGSEIGYGTGPSGYNTGTAVAILIKGNAYTLQNYIQNVAIGHHVITGMAGGGFVVGNAQDITIDAQSWQFNVLGPLIIVSPSGLDGNGTQGVNIARQPISNRLYQSGQGVEVVRDLRTWSNDANSAGVIDHDYFIPLELNSTTAVTVATITLSNVDGGHYASYGAGGVLTAEIVSGATSGGAGIVRQQRGVVMSGPRAVNVATIGTDIAQSEFSLAGTYTITYDTSTTTGKLLVKVACSAASGSNRVVGGVRLRYAGVAASFRVGT